MADNSSLSDNCPICHLLYLPPIYLCPKGHSLCNNCTRAEQYMEDISSYRLRTKVNMKLESVTKIKLFCGKCFCYYFNGQGRRDLQPEDSTNSKQCSCKYKDNGCKYFDSYSKIENHIQTCRFVIMKCYSNDCTWKGVLCNIAYHLESEHLILEKNKAESINNSWVYTIFCDDNSKDDFFLMKTLVTEAEVKFCVLYFGEANKYIFGIHVGSPDRCFITINYVIPQMTHEKKIELDFEQSEIFNVDLNLLREFFQLPVEQKLFCNQISFKINVTEKNGNKNDRDAEN